MAERDNLRPVRSREGRPSYFVGIRGEFLVLAELASRGILAAPTLGAAKQVDILVATRGRRRALRVEVKTKKRGEQGSRKLGPYFGWPVGIKEQRIRDRDLIYCFVRIDPTTDAARYFLVPARDVARCVDWGHRQARRVRNPDSTIREFKLSLSPRAERSRNRHLRGYPLHAYTGEAERSDRSIVNAPIGDRDRSRATLAGRSAVELALLSP